MTKVTFVKKARKDNPVAKAGENYYWWSFRFGGKHYSKTPPKPSQLTGSEYLSAGLALAEDFDPRANAPVEELADWLRQYAEQVRELGSEQEDKLSGMPDSLQEGPTGQLLQERSEACESMADELDTAADEVESLLADLVEEPETKDVEDLEVGDRFVHGEYTVEVVELDEPGVTSAAQHRLVRVKGTLKSGPVERALLLLKAGWAVELASDADADADTVPEDVADACYAAAESCVSWSWE